MYQELKSRLLNSLKYELDYVSKFENDKIKKYEKLLQIKNIMLLIEQYDEVEPAIQKAINELAEKKKWEERWFDYTNY